VLKVDKIEMRTYLDTCVWCRPFDAMISGRVLKEAESMNELIRKVDGVCD
jgi:hypothetical protein